MKVSIRELSEICKEILSRAENAGFSDIDINLDWYLDFYDLSDEDIDDPKIIVGSFFDDWSGLKKACARENPVSYSDFDRLGNVLKVIAEQIEKQGKIFIDTDFVEKKDQ